MVASSTIEYLDTKRLTRERIISTLNPYSGAEEPVNLRGVINRCHLVIQEMQRAGLLKAINDDGSPVDSFGFAMTDPFLDFDQLFEIWDDPYQLAWFVGGWGPKKEQYIANAVRKLRVGARTRMDSLSVARDNAVLIREPVAVSVDGEGRYPWGDFPWGGAVQLRMGSVRPFVSVSVFKQDEDVSAALVVGSAIGVPIVRSLDLREPA